MSQCELLHYSNHAVGTVLGKDAKLLHSMWEDGDLEGDDEARDLVEFIISNSRSFVGIETGDYIIPQCNHWSCETYDAYHRIYLVPSRVYRARKAELERVEREWREQAMVCRQRKDGAG